MINKTLTKSLKYKGGVFVIFKWKDRFNTGIEEIDNQHKRLFEIGSELFELASLDDGVDHYDEIVRLIDDLKDYTKYHFNFEEEYMEKFNYSDIDNHKREHQKFIDKLNETQSKDIDMEQKQVILDMIEFIISWVSGHIVGTDFKYRDLFIEKLNI